jgi:hypothetical protein
MQRRSFSAGSPAAAVPAAATLSLSAITTATPALAGTAADAAAFPTLGHCRLAFLTAGALSSACSALTAWAGSIFFGHVITSFMSI